MVFLPSPTPAAATASAFPSSAEEGSFTMRRPAGFLQFTAGKLFLNSPNFLSDPILFLQFQGLYAIQPAGERDRRSGLASPRQHHQRTTATSAGRPTYRNVRAAELTTHSLVSVIGQT